MWREIDSLSQRMHIVGKDTMQVDRAYRRGFKYNYKGIADKVKLRFSHLLKTQMNGQAGTKIEQYCRN